mgnify:CR=1 FL=1
MLSRTGALRIAAVEARSVQGDGGRWLQADRFMPRKQRHTAKRVYDRLVSEKGYEGSYSPVQRYVKRWREEHRLPSDGYLELKWHPGEAQVDFGMAQAVVGGDRVDVHCLVVTFPYSNMRYCVALPGENAECVCAGLRTVFEHIGAVPLTLVLDNATGAGHRIAWDKVTVVHVFELFVEHYRLETRFCNPNSGNEKGSVENAVGFLRRNIMVPMLNAESHGQLTPVHAGALRRDGPRRRITARARRSAACSPVRRWICSRFPPSRTTRSVGR